MNTRDLKHDSTIPDVQAYRDQRNLAIQRVGVRGLRYPLRWRAGDGEQHTVMQASLDVALPADQKGTHMSRFVALLEGLGQGPALDVAGMLTLHHAMLDRLQALEGQIEFQFPLFLKKIAPVSGVESLLDYQIDVKTRGSHEQAHCELSVTAPVTSLCPCSKEVSAYGAHNQRSHLQLEARLNNARLGDFSPEVLIGIAESQASSEVYGLLKRVDEKHVTERAYDNPKFVEDLVRDVAAALFASKDRYGVSAFCVRAENFESIHNHSAWAELRSSNW